MKLVRTILGRREFGCDPTRRSQLSVENALDWDRVRALLLSYPLVVEPVAVEDAERAAVGWRKDSGLSLADRLCLALGDRLEATVWTADAHWGSDGPVFRIR